MGHRSATPTPPTAEELVRGDAHPRMRRIQHRMLVCLYGRDAADSVARDLLYRRIWPHSFRQMVDLAERIYQHADARDTAGGRWS
jgi:DNA-binding winged helix-turn-helix (wHTH) protein